MIDDVADVEDLVLDDSCLLDELHLVAHHVLAEVVFCVGELVKAGLELEVRVVDELLLGHHFGRVRIFNATLEKVLIPLRQIRREPALGLLLILRHAQLSPLPRGKLRGRDLAEVL